MSSRQAVVNSFSPKLSDSQLSMHFETAFYRTIKSLLPTVIGMLVVLYLLFHIFQGDRGLLTKTEQQRVLTRSTEQLTQLEQQRETLQRNVDLLRRENLDLDMLEERARTMINFTRPDEQVIFYRDQ